MKVKPINKTSKLKLALNSESANSAAEWLARHFRVDETELCKVAVEMTQQFELGFKKIKAKISLK